MLCLAITYSQCVADAAFAAVNDFVHWQFLHRSAHTLTRSHLLPMFEFIIKFLLLNEWYCCRWVLSISPKCDFEMFDKQENRRFFFFCSSFWFSRNGNNNNNHKSKWNFTFDDSDLFIYFWLHLFTPAKMPRSPQCIFWRQIIKLKQEAAVLHIPFWLERTSFLKFRTR